MTIGNVVPSLIRTYVPVAVGALLSWLVTAGVIPTPLGPDAEAGLVTAITALGIGVYYTLARLLERKVPQASILLGSTKQPENYTAGRGGYLEGQGGYVGKHREVKHDPNLRA